MDPRPDTQARFTQTHWSVVLAAADRGSPEAEEALEKLCRTYWYPLYAFLRRSGHTADDAKDLVQGLFCDLLKRDWLANVGSEKGKFRSFLLTCLRNYTSNNRARNAGARRNPGQPIISIDAQEAEKRYRIEPPDEEDPAKIYERRWAFTLIERVLGELKATCAADGRGQLFEVLYPSLIGDIERGDFREVAARLNVTEGAARVAASRLRGRFRELLREEIARTVESPKEVEGEIGHLFALFGR
jgi:RNA polymerase sigma factor (sigma-70 family)